MMRPRKDIGNGAKTTAPLSSRAPFTDLWVALDHRSADERQRDAGFSYSGPKAYHAALLPTNLPLLSRRLQLPIPLGVDLLLTPGQHVRSNRCRLKMATFSSGA